MGVTA